MTEREQRIITFKLTRFIWLMFGLLLAMIALRIGLKLIGANPASPFAALLYGVTDIFLWPFMGLTGTPSAGGMVLEIPAFVALAVYALIGWAITRLVWVLLYRPRDVVAGAEHEPVHDHTSPHEHL